MKRGVVAALSVIFMTLSLSAEPTGESKILPAGDPGRGRDLFEEKLCFRCHTVEGDRFPEVDLPVINHVHLAGETNRDWSRDFFAREILDPQHLLSPEYQRAMAIIGDKLGAKESPMPDYRSVLTVKDLLDLVTYLEEKSRK